MDRSPFRDDVAAAHARAERLEAENRELRAKLAEATSRPEEMITRRSRTMLVAGVATVGVLVGTAFTMGIHAMSASPPEPARDLRGIATAKPTSADPTNGHARPPGSAACACEPGDPLCSCL